MPMPDMRGWISPFSGKRDTCLLRHFGEAIEGPACIRLSYSGR